MYTTLKNLVERVIQTNPSNFDERTVILRYIFVQITFETRK